MVLRAPAAFESIINTTLDAFGLLGGAGGGIPGTSLEIRQVEGEQRKVILLRDRAMPYQEPEFEAQLLTKKTGYPGNPIATIQVLRPDDSNTTFEGMWKDRFLVGAFVVDGNDKAVTTVDQAQALFDGVLRAGKLVRVQWLSTVRVGLLVRFMFKPLRAQDTKWELEFEWRDRDDSVQRRGAQLEVPSPDDLLNLYNTISDIVAMAPGVIASFNAVVVQAIRDVGDTLGTIVDLLRVVEAIVSLPAQVIGALQSAVLRLVRQVQELTRRLSDRWTQSVFGKTAALLMSSSSQSQTLGSKTSAVTSQASVAGWSRSLTLSLNALAFASQRSFQGVSDRVTPSGLRRVTVAEGETLYTLAERLYGSSDFANFLARANGLTSARVPPGMQLRAPGRPFGALGSIELSGGKQSGSPGAL